MNKWAVMGLVALFFLWIIYLRMEKDKENIEKARKHDEETKQ